MRLDVTLAQAVALASQLALVFAVSVLLGYAAGDFLDAQLSARPLFAILGSLAGMTIGVYGGVKSLFILAKNRAHRKTPER